MKKCMNDVVNSETASQSSMKDSGICCENLDENERLESILNSTSVSEVTTLPDETPLLGIASNQCGKENWCLYKMKQVFYYLKFSHYHCR